MEKKSILIILLIAIIATILIVNFLNQSINHPITPSIPSTPSITPMPMVLTTLTQGMIAAHIDQVNITDLKLGIISYAYITITNTGMAPITNEQVVTTAGKDFGFPIGYPSRSFTKTLISR